jgi:hypothetical protein
MTMPREGAGDLVLSWPSVSGRVYRVARGSPWIDVEQFDRGAAATIR